MKSFASDEAFRLAAVAIQVYGGAGYLKDHPVEQYTRDAKIYSIYEGTNHIQAMDLVGRKMGQQGGANFQAFLQDVAGFVEAHRGDATLGKAVELLAAGQEALMPSAMTLLGWSQTGGLGLIGLNANRFLTMMSQVAVGWLLLDAAAVAQTALAPAASLEAGEGLLRGQGPGGAVVRPERAALGGGLGPVVGDRGRLGARHSRRGARHALSRDWRGLRTPGTRLCSERAVSRRPRRTRGGTALPIAWCPRSLGVEMVAAVVRGEQAGRTRRVPDCGVEVDECVVGVSTSGSSG